jgi:hypothetical protein
MGCMTEIGGWNPRRSECFHLGPRQLQEGVHIGLVAKRNLYPADLASARCGRDQGGETCPAPGIFLQGGFRGSADGNETDRRLGEVQGACGCAIDLETYGPSPTLIVPVKLRLQSEPGQPVHDGPVPLPPSRPQLSFDVCVGGGWPWLVMHCTGHALTWSFNRVVASPQAHGEVAA